jgi:hypothetical protein
LVPSHNHIRVIKLRTIRRVGNVAYFMNRFIGKFEEMRPLRAGRRTFKDDNKIYLKDKSRHWIQVTHFRVQRQVLVNIVTNPRVP